MADNNQDDNIDQDDIDQEMDEPKKGRRPAHSTEERIQIAKQPQFCKVVDYSSGSRLTTKLPPPKMTANVAEPMTCESAAASLAYVTAAENNVLDLPDEMGAVPLQKKNDKEHDNHMIDYSSTIESLGSCGEVADDDDAEKKDEVNSKRRLVIMRRNQGARVSRQAVARAIVKVGARNFPAIGIMGNPLARRSTVIFGGSAKSLETAELGDLFARCRDLFPSFVGARDLHEITFGEMAGMAMKTLVDTEANALVPFLPPSNASRKKKQSDDEEVEEEQPAPANNSTRKRKRADDEDDEADEKPSPKKAKKAAVVAVDDEVDEKPAKTAATSSAKKASSPTKKVPEPETPTKKVAEPKKQETPTKKAAEPKKQETPAKKVAEPKKQETPTKKQETPAKKQETPAKKAAEPKKQETPAKKAAEPETPKKAAEPKKQETPAKKAQPVQQKKPVAPATVAAMEDW